MPRLDEHLKRDKAKAEAHPTASPAQAYPFQAGTFVLDLFLARR